MTGKLPDGLWPCPACGRMIEVLDGRWTQHTDPATYKARQMSPCRLAGRAALEPQTPPNQGNGQ